MNARDLFIPPSPRPTPAPRWAQYGATVDTAIRLTWGERLALLLGGCVVVRTWIALEKRPGRVDCDSRVFANPKIRKAPPLPVSPSPSR